MGLYDAMKDAMNLVQKADNIELYHQLLDLSDQALKLQSEVTSLKDENTALKKRQSVANRIERHQEPVVTLKGEEPRLYYCAHCWDSEQKLIQVQCYHNGAFCCPHCKVNGDYDKRLAARVDEEQDALTRWINY